jgi:hypothetical protein
VYALRAVRFPIAGDAEEYFNLRTFGFAGLCTSNSAQVLYSERANFSLERWPQLLTNVPINPPVVIVVLSHNDSPTTETLFRIRFVISLEHL